MRLLVLTDEIFPDATGGIGKSLYSECAAMCRHGHEVTVVVRRINHALPLEEVIDGIQVIRLPGPRRSSLLYYLYPVTILITCIQWLQRTTLSFDVLYILNPLYTLAAYISGAHHKGPVAYTFFASMASEIQIGIGHSKYGLFNPVAGAATWFLRPLERIAMEIVTVAFPRSGFSERMLRELCPSVPISKPLIPLGVNIKQFVPGDRDQARRQLALPLNRPILVCVRRLDYRMGLQNLIVAMTELTNKHPDVLLLIAGQGPIRTALDEQVDRLKLQDNIRLLGYVSEAELPVYLRAADLFVLPTELLEGFGLATLEALSCGCPVIGTPVGATPEVLAPIDPSLLTRDASPEALFERLNYWLDRQELLHDLGTTCRQVVETYYDIDVVANDLEDRFREMMQPPSAH